MMIGTGEDFRSALVTVPSAWSAPFGDGWTGLALHQVAVMYPCMYPVCSIENGSQVYAQIHLNRPAWCTTSV